MDEFDFIRDILSPLAGPEGLKLEDDAACFTPKDGFDLVITKDAMVEAVHFPKGHYGGDVAEKLLRVNLSDLAAKGARPLGYFLSLAIPKAMDAAHLKGFAAGLRDVQQSYDFTLWGGDTVSSTGPLIVSATFIGEVPRGEMVRRSGAKVGDEIWVTGTIGDAYLGLQTALGKRLSPQPTPDNLWHLEEAYLRPEPRLLFRKALRKYASAALDISDGFLADGGHLARVSQIGLHMQLSNVPFSKAAQNWLDGQTDQHEAYEALLSGGDDYEILFTAPSKNRAALKQYATKIGVRLTQVGAVVNSAGLKCFNTNGEAIVFSKTGYKHLG